MAAYHVIFGEYFPLPTGMMGHDYAGTLPGFTDGYLWFRQNGLWTPPWFTPSFCGGQVFFADPQSGYYSIPELLVFVMNVRSALYVAVLLFAALGFWGMYLLARQIFALSPAASVAAATLFMFNGFYAHRMIVGHYGFQPFMLVPWLSWVLCAPATVRTRIAGTALFSLLAGLILAYWLQAGFGTLIIPGGLVVLALVCIADLYRPGVLRTAVVRGVVAVVLSLALCASKLVAASAMLGRFERTYYPLPGIDDPVGILNFAFRALFFSSQSAYQTVTPLWRNIEWALQPHELAYGLTVIPLVLLAIGAVVLAFGDQPLPRVRLFPTIVLIAIVVTPFALLYYSPEWNEILKRVPIVGSTTAPTRWLLILVPLVCLISGLAVEVSRIPRILAFLVVLGVPILNAGEDRQFYQLQSYDSTPVVDFDQAVRNGAIEPAITRIEDQRSADGLPIADNLAFTRGASAIYCYNPLFGYRLEKYHPDPLASGPIDKSVQSGFLNLRNPACLLYPEENGCRPWDAFRVDQRQALDRFAHYRPFPFEVSRNQRMANVLSELTLLASVPSLVALGLVVLRKASSRFP
jgi:hypothetical protein